MATDGALSNGTKLTRDKVAFITGVTGQVSDGGGGTY